MVDRKSDIKNCESFCVKNVHLEMYICVSINLHSCIYIYIYMHIQIYMYIHSVCEEELLRKRFDSVASFTEI